MIINCGPTHDIRTMQLELPSLPYLENKTFKNLYRKLNGLNKENEIGVLFSGGADSALLYFLLLEEHYTVSSSFRITPYTIMREGSKIHAQRVINWIHRYYRLDDVALNVVGDHSLPDHQQVESGVREILSNKADFVYLGIIESRPEHSYGWWRHKFKETLQRKYPLLNLQKSHIIDLYYQKNLTDLLAITFSCNLSQHEPCNQCNGCLERNWGMNEVMSMKNSD